MTDPGFLVLLVLLAIAVGFLLAELAILKPQPMAALTLVALASPLFLDATNGLPTLARFVSGEVEAETGLHFAIPLVAIAAGVSLFRAGEIGTTEGRLIGLLAVFYTVSVAVGLLNGAGPRGLLYYGQTLIPLLAWVVFSRAGLAPRTVSLLIVLTVTVTLMLVVAAVLTRGGYADLLATIDSLASAIPQYRNYFPFIVMCAVALAIAGWNEHRRASIALLVATLAALPLMWSRTGMLMILVAVVVTYFRRPGGATTVTRLVVIVPLALVAGYFISTGLAESVIGARGADALEASNETRLLVAGEALQRVLARPVFGDAFVASEAYTAGGQLTAQPLLYPAHNQYLDAALRGGVLALFAVMALLALLFWRSWTLARRGGPHGWFHAAVCAVVAATIVGNLTQLYMVQPWSGGLLFALVGVSSALGRAQDRAEDRAPGVGRQTAALRLRRFALQDQVPTPGAVQDRRQV